MNEIKEQSFFYIFHAPLDKVYEIFKTPDLITKTFLCDAKIKSLKRNTSLDDNGNEFSATWNDSSLFTFKVESLSNLPYYKAFK